MTSQLIVIGSYNQDHTSIVPEFPTPGETVLSSHIAINHGGKGSNQAIAAARTGSSVAFISAVGEDEAGTKALSFWQKEKVNTSAVHRSPSIPTGSAQIIVNQHGENTICIYPGANHALHSKHIDHYLDFISTADMLLLQCEIPHVVLKHVLSLAHELNIPVIVNPAPAPHFPIESLSLITYLTPNLKELEQLSGISIVTLHDTEKAAKSLLDAGTKYVIVTLGKEGVLIVTENLIKHIPAPSVNALDTTGAGDCFNGVLASGLLAKMSLEEATTVANQAAAISVTEYGAVTSYPTLDQITNARW